MGKDEYHPLSKTGTNLSPAGSIGYFIIDSIDTMLLMGSDLSYEYQSARSWIQDHLTFDRDGKHNTFETTIRVLGGLLSAYHLSGNDPLYLEKAKDLGERMLGAFDTPSGLALPMVNLHEKKGVGEEYQKWLVSTAEAATLQLEFKYLAHLTDNDECWVKAEKVGEVVSWFALRSKRGFVGDESHQRRAGKYRVGAGAYLHEVGLWTDAPRDEHAANR